MCHWWWISGLSNDQNYLNNKNEELSNVNTSLRQHPINKLIPQISRPLKQRFQSSIDTVSNQSMKQESDLGSSDEYEFGLFDDVVQPHAVVPGGQGAPHGGGAHRDGVAPA